MSAGRNQRRKSTPTIRRTGGAGGSGSGRATGWLLAGALLLATLAAYQPAWRGGLVWDDDAHITRSDLRPVSGLRRIWIEPGATQQYYPLVHSAFWFLHRLWGDSTLGYHLVSIVLHAIAACLFAMILKRLAVPWPWLAALLFALHPVHVESVAWIAELKNTLSGVLFLGSGLAYLRFDESRRRRTYGLALALFALALLSKTVTATLPALLLVVFWWRRGRLDSRRDVLPLVPMFVLAVGFGALTAWAERALVGATGADFQLTYVERGLLAGRALWFYLGKLVWPSDLMFIYPRWQVSSNVWWQYAYPAAFVALLGSLWKWRTRSRAPLAAMLYFSIALFPALGFFNVYPFRYSFVADHFQYLASLGIIALCSGSVATMLGWLVRGRQAAVIAAVVVLVAPLAALTRQHSHDYADAETLYRATIARNPSCWLAHNNLAVLEFDTSLDDAMAHLEEALKSKPDYPEARNNLGLALQAKGRFEEAVAAHKAALQLDPNFADARNNLAAAFHKLGRTSEAAVQYREAIRLRPAAPQAYANLGNVLVELGRPEEAIGLYNEALRLDPTLASVRQRLGMALEKTGQDEAALAEFQRVLQAESTSADAHTGLGIVLERLGRTSEAISHYEATVRLQPESARARLNLGNALYRQGDIPRASAAFTDAVRLDPDLAEAHNNLGASFERLGRLDEAVLQYEETVRLMPRSAEARANLAQAAARAGTRRPR